MTENKFDQFIRNRNSLIDQYTKGDMDKDEFIEANYLFLNRLDIKPFQRVDNVKKALYNYQYYNVLAKYYQKKAHDLNCRHEGRKDFLELSDQYYARKDRVTGKLLNLLDFRDIEAYFIQVKSPNLKHKLFEIVLREYDDIILHSKNAFILRQLQEEGVFSSGERKSLIDSYINQKY